MSTQEHLIPFEPTMSDNKDTTIATLRDETDTLRQETAALKETVAVLQAALTHQQSTHTTYFASSHAGLSKCDVHTIPDHGMPASFVKDLIESLHLCDFTPQLNTSSYVNVVSEPEERDVSLLGAQVNLADGSVYPASVGIHDTVVNLLAELWHAPDPPVKGGNYSGAGTVGSTEACLLAGKLTKFSMSVVPALLDYLISFPVLIVCVLMLVRIGAQVPLA